MKKTLKKVLGVILIILGLLALLTPFSPGSWLALIGLEILGLRMLLERKLSYFLPERWKRTLKKFIKEPKRARPPQSRQDSSSQAKGPRD
jgi:uncharacterized membrane protein YkgB